MAGATDRGIKDDIKTINEACRQVSKDLDTPEEREFIRKGIEDGSIVIPKRTKRKKWRPTRAQRKKRRRCWYVNLRNRWKRRLRDLLRWIRRPWARNSGERFGGDVDLPEEHMYRIARQIGPVPTKEALRRGKVASASLRKVRLGQLRGRHQAWKAVTSVKALMTAFGFVLPEDAGDQEILEALWAFVQQTPRKKRAELDAVATAEGIQTRLYRILDDRKADA